MNEFFSELFQNKNFIMFSFSIVYILGLYAFFTDLPILFCAIFSVLIIVMAFLLNNLKMPVIYLVLFYFGFFYTGFRVKNFDELFLKAPADCKIVGQISSVPTVKGDGKVKFFFDVESFDSQRITGKTLVTVKLDRKLKPTSAKDFLVGNYCEIEGKLRTPFTATNPSQFSYDKYLRNFDVFTTFYTEEQKLKPIPHKVSMKCKVLQYLNLKREDIIKSHSRYLGSPNLEILGGVVFGDDAIAPPDYVKDSFIHSGLLHILAASGLNVGFISFFLLKILEFCRVPYRPRTICGILVIIFYALMTGLGASVVRASIMLIFILIGKLIDRDTHSIALLSFVALLMLMYNPSYINDVGFQLSFIVTFGIMISANAVLKYFKWVPRIIADEVFIPVIAQAWVTPIQMFYFNTISLYSIFANIISMPFLMVVSFGGFISAIFALIPSIADFVCKYFDLVLNPCLTCIVFVSDFFAKQNNSLLITTHPSIFQILIYYLILLAFIYLLYFGLRNLKIYKLILGLVLLLVFTATFKLPNHNFEVISFDVGNADAFLLRTPNDRHFIIDTGKIGFDGGKTQAELLILKYLKDKGIKDIDGIILTHYDSDHSGGAIDLINNLRVKSVYVNTLTDKKNLARRITKAINDNGYTTKILAKDGDIICDEVYRNKHFELKVIKPDLSNTKYKASDNENSVMTLAKYEKNTMLFVGDAGVNALGVVKNLPKDITIFKVGHHGAKGVVDKQLMETLNPKVSLVSVGYNKYGHPSPITIKFLEMSKVVRTDKINAIKVIFRPNNEYEVCGFNPITHNFYTKFKDVR